MKSLYGSLNFIFLCDTSCQNTVNFASITAYFSYSLLNFLLDSFRLLSADILQVI